ncbi:hypothetical protein [Pseudarthrobacter sp. N5]|uniref:hypothetical protein n=1 Tax=Pseudarthrobacter sp. N5 TaxID=3418416 RepID=UPI003CF9B8D1
MNTVLNSLAGTAAAISLTSFFYLRTMRRQAGTTPDGCCAGPSGSRSLGTSRLTHENRALEIPVPGPGSPGIYTV